MINQWLAWLWLAPVPTPDATAPNGVACQKNMLHNMVAKLKTLLFPKTIIKGTGKLMQGGIFSAALFGRAISINWE